MSSISVCTEVVSTTTLETRLRGRETRSVACRVFQLVQPCCSVVAPRYALLKHVARLLVACSSWQAAGVLARTLCSACLHPSYGESKEGEKMRGERGCVETLCMCVCVYYGWTRERKGERERELERERAEKSHM